MPIFWMKYFIFSKIQLIEKNEAVEGETIQMFLMHILFL